MPISPEYLTENEIWLEKLEKRVGQLSDQDLARPMEAGWTVSAVLAHLAFWDIRVVTLLQKWAAGAEITSSAFDADVVNEVARHLCLAVPPRTAAEMALTWGRKANQAIASLDPSRAAEIQQKAPNVRLDRTHHRRAHIGDINKSLA